MKITKSLKHSCVPGNAFSMERKDECNVSYITGKAVSNSCDKDTVSNQSYYRKNEIGTGQVLLFH